MKKISIIVPVYNAEKYLVRLIKSIENQQYSNYEIILVNDGSIDDSYKIMQTLAKENSKISIFSKNNNGPGETRKYGFKKSTGELLFFVDADDWLPNNSLININNIFEKKNPDILLFDRVSYRNGNKEKYYKPIENIKEGFVDTKKLKDKTIRGGLGCKIFKRDIFSTDFFVGGYNYEDVATTYLYLDKCHRIYYIQKVLYNVNRDSDNISLTKKIETDRVISAIDLILSVNNKIKNSSIKESLSFVIYVKYKELIVKYIKNFLKLNYKENYIIKKYLKKIAKIYSSEQIKKMVKNDKKITKLIVKFYWKCV